jgi:hypothetical protein
VDTSRFNDAEIIDPRRRLDGATYRPLYPILESVTMQMIGAALMARIGHATIKRAVE